VSRETVEKKAHRLLVAGRLVVSDVGEDRIRATCDGDHDRYDVVFERGYWSCSCPARGGGCSHLVALRLVTVQPRRPDA
jgi:hypothetical protein